MNGPAVVAHKVPESRRLRFLPRLVGPRHMMHFENLVYAWAGNLLEGYKGGLWDFYEIPGAGFFVPAHEPRYRVAAANGYAGELSAEAAGIVATLYALSQLANATEADAHIAAFHSLREFACTHPEGADILQAID